jgi:hypothetical protein
MPNRPVPYLRCTLCKRSMPRKVIARTYIGKGGATVHICGECRRVAPRKALCAPSSEGKLQAPLEAAEAAHAAPEHLELLKSFMDSVR